MTTLPPCRLVPAIASLMLLPFLSFSQTGVDSTIYSYQSGTVHHTRYNGFLSPQGFRLFTSKGDTIVRVKGDNYQNWEFRDIDGDGNKDIFLHFSGNTPDCGEVLLFCPATNTFKQVKGMENFPAPQKIPHSSYYYSYHKSGCADMNWDSDLFYIRNFKAVRIGNIAGRECHDRDIKDGIYISKIQKRAKRLFRELPIQTVYKYKEGKWEFIARYWQYNYKRFI